MSAVLSLSTVALLQPIGASSSDVVNALEPIADLLYNNSCILTVTVFICCGLLLIPLITSVIDMVYARIRRSKEERKSDD